MNRTFGRALLVWAIALAGCGAPREAGILARQTAQVPPIDNNAAARVELLRQADVWTHLEAVLQRRELGGIPTDARFDALVSQTAALARRQRAIIQAGEDQPALNAAVLEELRAIGRETATYLNK